MKGADQCPRCGCRKTGDVCQGVDDFYAGILRICSNCGTAWEPFQIDAVQHPEERNSSFKTPCNNCAFRKDSPEHRDPNGFQALLDQLGWWDGSFYCHKGIPITPGEGDGFAYPKRRDGRPDTTRLRLCRGYLNWLGGTEGKAKLALQMARAEARRSGYALDRWADDGGRAALKEPPHG